MLVFSLFSDGNIFIVWNYSAYGGGKKKAYAAFFEEGKILLVIIQCKRKLTSLKWCVQIQNA